MNLEYTGVDVFIVSEKVPVTIAPQLEKPTPHLKLVSISNRGAQIWPGPLPQINLVDVHQCRFEATSGKLNPTDFTELLRAIDTMALSWVHVEKILKR